MRSPHRSAALGVLGVGALAFAALAWWLVPWDPVGRPVEPVAASEVFTAAEIARAEHYAFWARVWSWSGLAVSLAVFGWLGFSRAGERLVDRLPGPRWLVVVGTVAAVLLVVRLASLPFSVALQQWQLENGLSTQSWLGWTRDVVLGFAVELVPTAIGLLILLWLARRAPRAWPALAGGLLAAFVLVASFGYPLVVEPLFNRFAPLPDGPLRSQVLELADREGVAVDQVLVADASRRTTTLNAYVSGFGSTRRVVLYDTLVDDAPRDEALAVVAHELAHAKHHDVVTGTVLGAAGALTGAGLLGLLLAGGAAADPRRVPRILALLAVLTFLATPVQSGISRQIEIRADVDSLVATNDPNAFVALHRRLAIRSLADPTPPTWSQWWFGSHPTPLVRLQLGATQQD